MPQLQIAEPADMLIDITMPFFPEMPVWPGDPLPQIQAVSAIAAGSPAAVSRLELSHCGTHVDAPSHLFPGGVTVEQLALDNLVGQAVVIDCGEQTSVGLAQLKDELKGARRVLLRSSRVFSHNGLYNATLMLEPAAAAWLVAQSVVLVGTSAPSLDAWDAADLPVHRILLSGGVVIVESLNLAAVEAG
ncbi:MAG: cyclase family protein [Chloroflexi bacterium]|nr:cyclase family protein [Chloroflexota bacterium]